MTFDDTGSEWASANQSHLPTPGQVRTPTIDGGGESMSFSAGGFTDLEMPLSMTQMNDDIGLQLMWDSYAMQFPNFQALWDDNGQASLGI